MITAWFNYLQDNLIRDVKGEEGVNRLIKCWRVFVFVGVCVCVCLCLCVCFISAVRLIFVGFLNVQLTTV